MKCQLQLWKPWRGKSTFSSEDGWVYLGAWAVFALYEHNKKLQLPLSSLEEEFKIIRTKEMLKYRESNGPKVAKAGIEMGTGRKWQEEKALLQAESILHQSKLAGVVAQGTVGLGSFPTSKFDTIKGKERCCLVQREVRAAMVEKKTWQDGDQGAWMRWDNALERKVTWAELWKAKLHWIQFLVQAVHDTLPSLANLHTWGKADTPVCPLCSRCETLLHILSCWSMALRQGRYCWQHDWVLKLSGNPSAQGSYGASGPTSVQSLARVFSTLSIEGQKRRRAICDTSNVAETASRWLWLKQENNGGKVASLLSRHKLMSDQLQLGYMEVGCMMLKGLEHPVIPGTTLKMYPEASVEVCAHLAPQCILLTPIVFVKKKKDTVKDQFSGLTRTCHFHDQ